MARSLHVLALILSLGAPVCLGQEPLPATPATPAPTTPPPPPPNTDWQWRKDRPPKDKDLPPHPPLPPLDRGNKDDDGPMARFRKRLDQMSPEDRQHFQENWKRWKEMNAGEQKDWQTRAKEEHDRIKKVIDDAIQKAGLKLDDDQREVFALRYRQERRKIEEQLRKEMDAKRATEIDAMLARLKTEFSAPKTPAPTPTPSDKP